MIKRKRLNDIQIEAPRLSVFDDNDVSSIKCLENSFTQIEALAKEVHNILDKKSTQFAKDIKDVPNELLTGFALNLSSNDVFL